ncbi:MAG: DUF1851 domain-containing protein [Oscillospiraceae bacterium]|nr:DUF1851 domain-containing protein [Oscillospiraceae bacterium]
MDENAVELFKNSIKHADVPEEIIEKYRGKVSDDIISLWREYGFCTTEDGYYKLVNPDDYADIFREIYGGSDKNPVVLFVTAMADIIFYDDDRYFNLVDIRHEKVDAIGDDEYFSLIMRRMRTADFRHVVLSWEPYEDAVKKLGVPTYEECFAYEPLLSLGGKEKIENLHKVNLAVHLDIVSQMQDAVTW